MISVMENNLTFGMHGNIEFQQGKFCSRSQKKFFNYFHSN